MTKATKNNSSPTEKITHLLKKGVRITNPFSVEIADDVHLDRIASSATIYGAARIAGENTLIGPDVKLGEEGPVTLINSQLGAAVELRGGSFTDSVFLAGATLGGNAQVRAGCLLEEKASGNHTVGLKQTILFPYVTLGSLINFCDCLMAGGTSRKNHSEVGSSYIHFNYTPQQDKATASLIGNVPRGVMLREHPIFLGGQGGMVGPVQIAFGVITPAGIISRSDCPTEDTIYAPPPAPSRSRKFIAGAYGDIRRKVHHNVSYIANLLALQEWYQSVRRLFLTKEKFGDALYFGAHAVLESAIAERIKQMRSFAQILETSLDVRAKSIRGKYPAPVQLYQECFLQKWPQMEEYLACVVAGKIDSKKKEVFIKTAQSQSDKGFSYLDALGSLTPVQAKTGSDWLNKIVMEITTGCLQNLTISRPKRKS